MLLLPTGDMFEMGADSGRYYSVNVPLKEGIDDTSVVVGRQRLILDNARFVGNVGWRQNEQTFDAIKVSNKSFKDVELTLAHISQVNNIRSLAVGTSHNLLNARFDKTPVGTITAYAYLLDNDASTADTDTFGARLKGKSDSFLYTAELAQQSEGGDSSTDFSATYAFAELGDLNAKEYKSLLYTLPSIAGLAGGTFRIPNSFMIMPIGGRVVICMTTLLLAIPCIVSSPQTQWHSVLLPTCKRFLCSLLSTHCTHALPDFACPR